MAQVFRLKDANGGFLTRDHGGRVREELVAIFKALPIEDRLVIDFEGIDIMSPSFADECVGKLAENLGVQTFRTRVTLRGANETNRILINGILNRRLSPVPRDDPD